MAKATFDSGGGGSDDNPTASDLGWGLPDDLGSDDGGSSSTNDDPTSGGSSSSSSSDRYGTSTNSDGSYNVPSGTAAAVGPEADEQMQSDQVMELDEKTDGALDTNSLTTSTNDDGTTNLSGESALGDSATVTSTSTVDGGTVDPESSGLPVKAIAAVVALLALVSVRGGSN